MIRKRRTFTPEFKQETAGLALGEVTADGRNANTYLLYTDSLVNYLKRKGTVQLPLRSDYSHQQVIHSSVFKRRRTHGLPRPSGSQ